nr:unnamed protein product [Callosobruchus analis]
MNSVEIKAAFFDGYKLIPFFSRSRYSCGGVAIWAKNDITVKSINVEDVTQEKDFELAGIRRHFEVERLISMFHSFGFASPSLYQLHHRAHSVEMATKEQICVIKYLLQKGIFHKRGPCRSSNDIKGLCCIL